MDAFSGLRNERKPCHFWIDNEVADCYQPIIGADAIWVYCRIARYAHGAWIVSPRRRGLDGDRVALREMAQWCGKSVDTVWRCLELLELVGLICVQRGARAKGRYALADVKELVTREGATYDADSGGFRLPEERVAELKRQVKELRLKLARKGAGLIADREAGGESVALSDRFSGDLFSAPEAKCDRSVAPAVQICRSSSTDINLLEESKTTKQTQTLNPNPARARESDCVEAGTVVSRVPGDPDLSCAAAAVMHKCRFTARRLRVVIRDVIAAERDRGVQPEDAARNLAAAWERYTSTGALLKRKWDAMQFFGEGYWAKPDAWAWDEQAIQNRQMEARARVGTFTPH